MKRVAKPFLLILTITGSMFHSFADRGVRKKSKNISLVNVSTSSLRSLKSSELYPTNTTFYENNSTHGIVLSTIKSFQKGNTVYILPSHQKLITPEIKQGYTGMKLIIKSKS